MNLSFKLPPQPHSWAQSGIFRWPKRGWKNLKEAEVQKDQSESSRPLAMTDVLKSQQLLLPKQDLHKNMPTKLLAYSFQRFKRPHSWRVMDSGGLLHVGESVFFKGVAPDESTMLQWVALQLRVCMCVYGQQKIGFSGLLKIKYKNA